MSDTPRTDALEAEMHRLSYSAPNNYCITLCQQLERELNSNKPPLDGRMDELWNAIREMEPTLGNANKPLAIAASYALLKGDNEKLTRERNALDAALRERDKQLIASLSALREAKALLAYRGGPPGIWEREHSAILELAEESSDE